MRHRDDQPGRFCKVSFWPTVAFTEDCSHQTYKPCNYWSDSDHWNVHACDECTFPLLSVQQEPNFCSVWEAQERANVLAHTIKDGIFDVDFDKDTNRWLLSFSMEHWQLCQEPLSLQAALIRPLAKPSSEPHLVPHLFQVQELDQFAFEQPHPQLPDEVMAVREDDPPHCNWSHGYLHSPQIHRPDLSEVPHFHDPPVASDDSAEANPRPWDRRTSLRHHPAWVETLWQILQDEGAVELLEEGPIVYLGSYYISHAFCRRQADNRPLRLDQHYDHWAQQIADVWHDHLDRAQPFEVHLVRPEPPIPVTRGTVGIVLIVQHPRPRQVAVLTTAMYDNIGGPRIVEIAHSFDTWINPTDILHSAEALEPCQEVERQGFGPCTIRVGRRTLPRDRLLRCDDGLGLVIRIPMLLTEEEWETRVFARLRAAQDEPVAQPPPETGAAATSDETTLMARRPRLPPSAPSPSSSDSSIPSSASMHSDSTTSTVWRRMVIFALDGRALSLLLPDNDDAEMRSRIVHAFDIEPADFHQLHVVTSRPDDLVQVDLLCGLLQRRSEARQASNLRLVLLDVEVYEEQDVQPSAFRRKAAWAPHITTRLTLFRLLGLESVFLRYSDRTRLWINNEEIGDSAPQPMHIDDGDYVKIFIGEEDRGWRCLSDSDLPDLDESTLLQVPPFLQGRITDSHGRPEGLPRCSQFGQQRLRHRGHQDDPEAPDDHEQLFAWLWGRRQVQRRGLEGEPVMYLTTWFLSSMNFPRCSVARAVALTADVSTWSDQLQQVWRDRVHPHSPVQFHYVAPQPREGLYGGHLLLLQHPHPDQAGVLMSTFSAFAPTGLEDRFAQMLPSTLSLARFIWYHDYERPCAEPSLLCKAYHGTVELQADTIWRARTGQHLELHISIHPDWEYEDDAVELMQAMTMPRLQPALPAQQHGTDLPTDCAECQQFQFNSRAPACVPNQPTIFAQTEFIQDLHQLWQASAMSWESEEPSGPITVWFVDHTWHWPHGWTSRTAHLFADFSQWEELILRTWQDHRVRDAPYELVLVQPNRTVRASTMGRAVITTHERLLLEHLLQVLGLYEHCLGPAAPQQCQAWFDRLVLLPGTPHLVRSGAGIMLQTRHRHAASVAAGPVLLQLSTQLLPQRAVQDFGERQTADTVAHGQRPLNPEVPVPTQVVRLRSGCSSIEVPSFIEVSRPHDCDQVLQELQSFGLRCRVYQFGGHDEYLCVPLDWHPDQEHHMYSTREGQDASAAFLHTWPARESSLTHLDHMRLLHSLGFFKTAILDVLQLCPGLVQIIFVHL
eukprot:s2841_g5.t1